MKIPNKIASKTKLPYALCTVVDVKGSVPGKLGFKMLVYSDGTSTGSIGGGNLEKVVIENAQIQISKSEPKLFFHNLLQQHNMCCGGSVQIFIEPIMMKNNLYIFGAGHIGNALVKVMNPIDFNITIIDDRIEQLSKIKDDEIIKLCLPHNDALSDISFDNHSYIVILTYDHVIDREILAYCIKKDFAYLGMIGSKRKILRTKKMFIENKLATLEELEKIDMPMGLNIFAEGPEEIALSIASKLVKIKNKKYA